MRAILIALALSAVTASAESPQCVDCVILTPERIQALEAEINDHLRQAFEAGKASQKASCASLI